MIEADESDRSLLKLEPEIAVLTNAELDHHATYTLAARPRADAARVHGRAMRERAVVWDRPELRRAVPPDGASPYDAAEPQLDPRGSRFQSGSGSRCALTVPGAHNAINAAGALTACALAGADPRARGGRARRFQGARRRLELLGRVGRAGRGLRRLLPPPDRGRGRDRRRSGRSRPAAGGRLSAAPLLAHARARARVRRGARRRGLVVVLPVYPARERAADFPGVDGHLVAAAAADAAVGRGWPGCRGSTRRVRSWTAVLREGDVCLVMGAGDIDSLARSLVA